MRGEYFNLLWINEEEIANPKGLISMDKEKAVGSIKWTKTILGDDYRCIIYDPQYYSIFNKDGSYNWKIINRLERQTKELVEDFLIENDYLDKEIEGIIKKEVKRMVL